MKKALALLLVCIMTFSLVACGAAIEKMPANITQTAPNQWHVEDSDVYMLDSVNALSDDEESALLNTVSQYGADMYFNIFFVTYANPNDDVELQTIEASALELVNGQEDNIIFARDVSNNQFHVLRTGRGAEWLPDIDIMNAQELCDKEVAQDDLGAQFAVYAHHCLSIIASGGRTSQRNTSE